MKTLLDLSQAFRFDCRRSAPLFINPDEVASVGTAVVGERSEGAEITLKSGEKFLVWDSVDRVMNLIARNTKEEA